MVEGYQHLEENFVHDNTLVSYSSELQGERVLASQVSINLLVADVGVELVTGRYGVRGQLDSYGITDYTGLVPVHTETVFSATDPEELSVEITDPTTKSIFSLPTSVPELPQLLAETTVSPEQRRETIAAAYPVYTGDREATIVSLFPPEPLFPADYKIRVNE